MNLSNTIKSLISRTTGALVVASMVGCGGGGGDSSGGGGSVLTTPSLSVAVESIKTLKFSWIDIPSADYYELYVDEDGSSGFSLSQTNIPAGTTTIDMEVPLYQRLNARFILSACYAAGCVDSSEVSFAAASALNAGIGYIKADSFSNETVSSDDLFGYTVALSDDGSTMAVGALGAENRTGRVYLYRKSNNDWALESTLDGGAFRDSGDDFATSISLSADGDTLAVGARREDSANSDRSNNTSTDSGAVYLFSRSGTTWNLDQFLKQPSNSINAYNGFGSTVDLDDGATRLAVAAIGTNTTQGAVYIYRNQVGGWVLEQALTKDNPNNYEEYGASLSISGDGETLAVGVPGDSYALRVIWADRSQYNSFQDNLSSREDSGAVYVYSLEPIPATGGASTFSWDLEAYIKSSNSDSGHRLGQAVSLNQDGSILAATATGESSLNDSAPSQTIDLAQSGAAYVFERTSATWAEEGFIKATIPGFRDRLGNAIELSSDGSILIVSAVQESSLSVGLSETGDLSLGTDAAGAVYAYENINGVWESLAHIKASNTSEDDQFGRGLALSGDGETIAVGSYAEDSASTSTPSDESSQNSGAAYLY